MLSRIMPPWSFSIAMTRCAGWTARSRVPARSPSSGAPPGRQVVPARRTDPAQRRPVYGRRSIGAAGAAALSGRGGRRAVPRLLGRGVSGLALASDPARRGGRPGRLAWAVRAGRAALSAGRGPCAGRGPAEPAGSSGATAAGDRLRLSIGSTIPFSTARSMAGGCWWGRSSGRRSRSPSPAPLSAARSAILSTPETPRCAAFCSRRPGASTSSMRARS